MPASGLVSGPETGETLDGRYELCARVGSGGMAAVYRARDRLLDRDVAVKLFHPVLDDDDQSRQRRFAETRLLASLNHPSLVTLYDARVDGDDHPYLVMEFIDGPTLRERMADGPIPAREISDTAAALADALAVVHAAGIVHRDLKPSNVLLRPSVLPGGAASATLADFGIAYLLDSTRVTTPGTTIGTAAYLAPEQVRGEAPAPPADIYALGLMLMECLSGRHPFGGGTPQEMLASRVASTPRIPAGLSVGWRSLLVEMTAHDPADRPTAAQVAIRARALRDDDGMAAASAAIADHPTEPYTVDAPAPSGNPASGTAPHAALAPARRRRAQWSAAVVAVALCALLLAIGVVLPAIGVSPGGEAPTATAPRHAGMLVREAGPAADPSAPGTAVVDSGTAPAVVEEVAPSTAREPSADPGQGNGSNGGNGNGNNGNGNNGNGNGNNGNGNGSNGNGNGSNGGGKG
ncbi:serine/threonine-protein kinase [Microbacterium gilvum]|uniref:non-specific serine/threonine protein kinase n=1 Tax=Microbacterium gilvum TaxID=1336204 RepID=A0ABP9A757_9MICO